MNFLFVIYILLLYQYCEAILPGSKNELPKLLIQLGEPRTGTTFQYMVYIYI